MVNAYGIPRKNATAAQAYYQNPYRTYPVIIYMYQPATTIGSKQSSVKAQAISSEFRHSHTGIQESRSRRGHTSAGPLLVEDAVAALAALDHITRLQRVLGSTVWKKKSRCSGEKTTEELNTSLFAELWGNYWRLVKPSIPPHL
jgi:hypothetical protein